MQHPPNNQNPSKTTPTSIQITPTKGWKWVWVSTKPALLVSSLGWHHDVASHECVAAAHRLLHLMRWRLLRKNSRRNLENMMISMMSFMYLLCYFKMVVLIRNDFVSVSTKHCGDQKTHGRIWNTLIIWKRTPITFRSKTTQWTWAETEQNQNFFGHMVSENVLECLWMIWETAWHNNCFYNK